MPAKTILTNSTLALRKHIKRKRFWSNRILVRYAILQIPGLALLIAVLITVERWIDLPAWFVWGTAIAWFLKDAFLFPFVWRAYDWNGGETSNTMIGVKGIAKERLDPAGYVLVRGELWKAKIMNGYPPVDEGKKIKVQEIQGLTLVVVPESPPEGT